MTYLIQGRRTNYHERVIFVVPRNLVIRVTVLLARSLRDQTSTISRFSLPLTFQGLRAFMLRGG